MARRTLLASSVLCASVLFEPAAQAGHPMLSEDTGTQGTGNAELELGFDWSRDSGSRAFLFQPQLSYGLTPKLDLIVQPSWLAAHDPQSGSADGFGDTNLDAKWRFYGAAPLSLGIRAGFELPTDQKALGLPHRDVSGHAVLVATLDMAPFSFDGNFGYTLNPNGAGLRTQLYHVSAAANYAVNERFMLVVDSALDTNPDPTRESWPAVALAGAIYTLRPGLDIDAGYRAGLNSAAATAQWLLGITYRWAP